ncbi:nucleoside deaminase [Haladaptatus pallidirubidus]|uniref:CMP/dCMP-type deaminase domain-containing protein n=1 Tax=Haladaptatus pallidirubidus TaxID=1008152 RepID=A0AAV3ULJ4_9EURY|nr:nucleoside deaminase [Haladaptatus pallidirubidus]
MPNLDSLDHEKYVQRTLALAREAGERGDGHYGSILVHENEIVMEETNRENTDDDLALHPELTLARRAERELSPDVRKETVMYTSTEPCPMCAGGIAIAGLGAVVYSISGEHAAEEFGGMPGVPCDEIFERKGRDIEVVSGVLKQDGLALHRKFR